MRLIAALKGDLKAFLKEQTKEAERAGLGARMARTWRMNVYPSGPSIGAAGWVYSRAPLIVSAHAEGATIRSGRGRYLAIPAPAAPRPGGGGRPTPATVEKALGQKLRFVPRPRRTALLVADGVRVSKAGRPRAIRGRTRKKDGATWSSLRGVSSAVMFFLVPSTKLRKKLDIQKAFASAQAALPGAVLRHWKD